MRFCSKKWLKRVGCALVIAAVLALSFHAFWFHGRFAIWSVEPPAPQTVSVGRAGHLAQVIFAGDTLLGDAAQKKIAELGYEGLLQKMTPWTREADLGVLNLEAPITERALSKGDQGTGYKQYRYAASPLSLDALKAAGFSVMTLGNNHTLDRGFLGLVDTLKAAEFRGIRTLGAGRDEAEARRGLIVDVGGFRLGLLNGYKWRAQYDFWLNWYALGDRGGVAELAPYHFKADVARLRAAGAHVVIALPHWGVDYRGIDHRQRRLAKALVAAGVDAILGHGTHVGQPFELVDGVPVLFSMGNFVFGTPGRDVFTCGYLPTVSFDASGIRQITIRSLVNQNRKVHFVPYPNIGDAAGCLSQLRAHSHPSLESAGDALIWRKDDGKP